VLETLVHRQDDQFSGSGQFAVVEQPGQIGQGAGIIAAVPTQDFFYSRCVHICIFNIINANVKALSPRVGAQYLIRPNSASKKPNLFMAPSPLMRPICPIRRTNPPHPKKMQKDVVLCNKRCKSPQMRITVDVDSATLNELSKITGEKKKSPAVALAVREFIKREKARKFGRLLREGGFDYPATNDEIEKSQG
jgi:Arc/MetJ family transcription regulator